MLMLQRAKESRSQANKTANMAAKHFYRQGFLLLLFNFISTAALEKRFSDFKRCADEECSMLLCRGKAVKDFSGPDCRFLSFKKSETIYVYYKLSGKRADLWAGSVGSNFGYFPKDLLAVNHLYTEKELEIKAEETDFVCFDTGYDKFDSYDIDLLLGLSVEENDGENNGITGKDTESIEEETKPSVEEVTEIDTQTEHVKSEELHEDQSASLPKLEINTSTDSSLLKDEESNTATVPVTEDEEVQQQNVTESPVQIMPESSETTDESDVESALVTVSEGVQIPQLNPTLGTTFDAVVTEEEITTKVTPYEEEDSEDLQDHPEEHKEEVPLLSFLEEPTDNLEMDSPKEQEKLSPAQKEDPNGTEEKNLWTSLGDAVFSVVTGGETTGEDVSSDEDDEDEDEDEIEETAAEPEKSFEKTETEPILPDNQKHPEDMEPPPPDPHQSNSVEQEINGTKNDPEKLLFDGNVGDQEVSEHKDEMEQEDKASNSPSEPEPHETEESSSSEEPVLNDDLVSTPDDDKSGDETPEDEDELEDPEISKTDDNIQEKTVVEEQLLDGVSDESRTTSEQELGITESEKVPDQSSELKESNDSDITVDQHLITDEKPDQINDNKVTDVESNTSPTLVSVEEEEIREQTHIEEEEDEKDAGTDKEINEEKEELLEDENALLSAQSDDVINEKSTEETTLLAESAEEPEYSENIMRLSLLREHFTEEKMEHIQKLLGLKNLFKVEAMFSDLDTELKATRLSHTDATQDVESTLENILEASENTILDEIEKMLDSREKKQDEHQAETSSLDEETEMLDDFQELAFSLRQKYSTTSDSAPLATPVTPLESTHDQPPSNVAEEKFLPIVEEKSDNVPETDEEYNLTVAEDLEEESTKIKEEQVVWNEENMIPEKDAEDSDKNKDQSSLTVSDEEEKVTQPTPDYQLDVDVETEVQHYPSGSVDYMETVKEKAEEELGLFTTGTVYMCCIFSVIKNKTVEWTTVMISLLPEEWKPGETLFGCPWQAVVVTVLIGVLTFTIFFWRTVLAVKKSKYLVDEKKLKDKIHTLIKDKSDALAKISELQKQTEQLKENQKQSKATVSCTMKRMQALESKVVEADKMNEQMAEEKNKYSKLLEEERAISLQNDSRLEKLEKANEKLQVSRKKIQEALAKTTILLDEAKIREDARNAQHKCFQKEFAALKEEKKTLKTTIKGWEEKHKELNEKIKVYQKSHKELEDSVVLKDHNVEVLSELLADLDACDLQKGETSVLANGEVAPADKKTAIKNRIKQMMDVTRVQTTLTVIEEERDRFMAKLLNEEKSRKELEEKHQELEHSIGALKSEKSQIENQYTILQQKNEIMVEMYQQKENALQQRLTKEELERRSKENLLSEVGGKAVEAEEQVKLLRQRINEMEEQMKKTEEVYKEQIKEQENKTHSNWVNARNAERALSQEKVESSKLREKLAILTSQLNERRAPLFRPNSGQPPGPRQGDSYGPSPVSGGAPSPPIMIEGPRRPPSAPVGRRIDPYGPRPPSDPHGIYPENKHIMDMMGPRSSSPANPDGSGPGSFIASPIRDSPGSMVQRPPPGPGPHDPFLPPGPNVRLPPPGPYGHPRPGPYPLPPGPLPPNVPPLHGPPLPANGHPGMPLPGPMGGEFGPRPANGHLFQPRLGPDQRGPPPPHFRPPPPHNFGPMPPPLGVRGPLGPRPLIPHDMRFPGPRDHISPPMDLLPGVPPPGGPPLPAHPGRGPPGNPQNSAGPQRGPAPDTHLKQEAPQDSVRPAMV